MPDSRKNPVARYIAETESVRLTNWSIRTAWKTGACLLALTMRLFAAIVLAIARIVERRRSRW